MTWSAGVIAAGHGARLARSHPGTVKPLVLVAGRPLAHWIVGGLRDAGAHDVTLLVNSRNADAMPASLRGAFPTLPLDFVVADTASSFESFRRLALRLARRDEAFLISTVDAIVPSPDVARFWAECRAARADAGLALTAHVDDENPLWADVDEAGLVRAAGDDARSRRLVACGLYYVTRAAAARLPEAAAHPRLRDFWRALAASGARVCGPTLSKTFDVDRPEDVAAAASHLNARSPV